MSSVSRTATAARARPRIRRALPLILLGVVLACDGLIHLLDPPYPALGVFDEPAHLATGAIVLLSIRGATRPFAIAFMVSVVAIDLDHAPAEFGLDTLMPDGRRPVTHSLVAVAAFALLALVISRRPAVAAGVACGLLAHFFRDLGTGGGAPLFWPFDDGFLSVPYAVYLAALTALAVRVSLGSTRALRRASPPCARD